jgi:poly-gamma-glutamate capsule biosynthesis protein CapA/YwtB (metallophosphatase superfamily)
VRIAALAAAATVLVACAHVQSQAQGETGAAAGTGTGTGTAAGAGAGTAAEAVGATPIATATPAATPAAPAAPAPEREITLALVGDVMLGSTFPENEILPPDEARGLLAEAAPILAAADLAIGNLEGPMLEGGESEKCKRSKPGRCYAFRMPVRYAERLREAGFDAMSVANNHAGDFGAAGRASTRRALDGAGIAHSGEPGDVARLEVRGTRLALVAFATSDATHDLRDVAGARELVAGLAREVDLVVVSFHGGAEGAAAQHVPRGPEEFYGESRGDLRAFARAMVDAGAALVFGHGPHVVRGMEVYRGRLIAYSLGNFATWGSFNLSGPNALAPVLEVRLGARGDFRGGRVHAFRQDRPGGPRRDGSGEVIRRLRDLSREDFGAAAVQVAEDGALSPPAPAPGS